MRFLLIFAALTMLFLSPLSRDVRAAVWVEQISGDPKAVVVVRKGDFLKAEEMMRLKSGDVIKVLDDGVSIRILLGSGTVKKITRAKSPYTVAGKEKGSSLFANLVGEVKQMLTARSDHTEAVAMMTRGRSKQLRIMAVGAEENLLPAGTRELALVWQGGKGPWNISLLGEETDKPLFSRKNLAQRKSILATDKTGLEAGEYQLVLEDSGARPQASREITLMVVERDELPEKVRKLSDLKLDKRVEARFMISLLYKQSEWRLYAHSLAARYDLKKEQLMLERMK